MPRNNRRILSVYQINQYIRGLLEEDIILNDLCVEAEISNFKPHSSGHMYFTLKDEQAAVSCVMFRSHAANLAFMPENGMKVILFGRVSLYEKTGVYQIYAEHMEPSGVGALYLAFMRLKQKLADEGLFDVRHKSLIPEYPACVAVITSPTGAVLHDIVQISKRRNPLVRIVVWPVSVQGQTSANEVADAIERVNEWGLADVIIIARGGGSLEDLWAFNQEAPARAVFKSRIPIISAIGHETDFTILDFAADLRAPTPSAAAELAIPPVEELKIRVAGLYGVLNESMVKLLDSYKARLDTLNKIKISEHLLESVYNRQLFVEQLLERLGNAMRHKLEIAGLATEGLFKRLEAAAPEAVLRRGYSILYLDGKVVAGAEALKAMLKNNPEYNADLIIKLRDGVVKAKLVDITEY